jgi:hypothetical protein
MLSMKSWFEIRWRLLFALGLVLFPLGVRYTGGLSSAEDADKMMDVIALLCLFVACFLAGAGVKTQSSFQANKGLHGSTMFTLCLPVSRFRLLAVRTGVGTIGVFGIILISSTFEWILFPLVRASSTPTDFLKWIFTVSCCAGGFYAISLLVSTVLDEVWQIWGAVIAIGALKGLTVRFPPPPSLDVFRVMAEGSPLLTHTIPWPAISVSLGLTSVLFFAAIKVVQEREY